jgi:hypothetical protein
MPSGSDRDWLKAELAEPATQLRRFGWAVEPGYHSRTEQEFLQARHGNPLGIDESMVTARFGGDGRLLLERYILPRGMPEWIKCDEDAFLGFLEEGISGLNDGRHFVSPTACPCDKKVHRSLLRGQAFARRVAAEAGSEGFQRAYRCVCNPRSVHLTSKEKGEPIPGAYVVLNQGWNS